MIGYYLILTKNNHSYSCPERMVLITEGQSLYISRDFNKTLPFPDKHEVGTPSATVGSIKASLAFRSSRFCVIFEGRFFLLRDFSPIIFVWRPGFTARRFLSTIKPQSPQLQCLCGQRFLWSFNGTKYMPWFLQRVHVGFRLDFTGMFELDFESMIFCAYSNCSEGDKKTVTVL